MPEHADALLRYLPSWAIGICVVIFAIAASLGALEPLFAPCRVLLGFVWRSLTRQFYAPSKDMTDFLHRRKMFAGLILGQLVELDSHESWQDNRFTELEAEVEITEGRERIFKGWRNSPTRRVALRREKSLTRALRRSRDPLILLEGEPGSGKSVAMRHLATQLARRISGHAEGGAEIPLYINLKGFRPDCPIGANAVREYILQIVSQMNDIDVERFVSEALDGTGGGRLRRGGASWLLLMDSFDEIPDILSATDSNEAVRDYAQAINDFIAFRRDRIRLIVASRAFRGPRGFGQARFRIISLTDRQQKTLIGKTSLPPEVADRVIRGLPT